MTCLIQRHHRAKGHKKTPGYVTPKELRALVKNFLFCILFKFNTTFFFLLQIILLATPWTPQVWAKCYDPFFHQIHWRVTWSHASVGENSQHGRYHPFASNRHVELVPNLQYEIFLKIPKPSFVLHFQFYMGKKKWHLLSAASHFWTWVYIVIPL